MVLYVHTFNIVRYNNLDEEGFCIESKVRCEELIPFVALGAGVAK